MSKLGGAGKLLGIANLSNDSLTDSVSKQAMNGIFSYMGKEEAGLRGNLLGVGKGLLDKVL